MANGIQSILNQPNIRIKIMAFDQKKYEAARDELIVENEHVVNNIYLDVFENKK